jgi:uncharacterized protein (DUF1330 family)
LGMNYTRLVAMNVTDPTAYAAYRAAMLSILKGYGGGFAYDAVVQDVTGSFEHPVTRIFAITFGDKAACQEFFADPAYAVVRAQHFEGAVEGFTEMAAYSCAD